jgi:hypothetical protein
VYCDDTAAPASWVRATAAWVAWEHLSQCRRWRGLDGALSNGFAEADGCQGEDESEQRSKCGVLSQWTVSWLRWLRVGQKTSGSSAQVIEIKIDFAYEKFRQCAICWNWHSNLRTNVY